MEPTNPQDENRRLPDLSEAEERFLDAVDDAEFHLVDIETVICRRLYQRDRDKIGLWALKGSVWVVWIWALSWYPLYILCAYLKLSLPPGDLLGWTCALGFVSILSTGFPGVVKIVQAWFAARKVI